ncbi:MAG: Flp pilus assembly protein CpaB [Candidatus Obscuribacterales bacterium]|nr:Flp pilus assembly protein CpaB [Candidatus Obscuribacterales bacterium]
MNPMRSLVLSLSRIPPALLLVGIIGIACGATLLVTSYLEIRDSEYKSKLQMAEDKLKAQDARVVYVAKDVQEGSLIDSQSLVEKQISMNRLPQDAITSSAMATGRIAKYTLSEGQILSQHDLAPIGISLGFESRLPKGMRAVTFAVDNNSGVAGFVTPDSRVDIISMVGSGADTQVAPILSDVKVIAVGQTYEKSTGKTDAMPSNSVTVAVAPEDAQKLVKGVAASKIYLSLRNKDDRAPVVTMDVTALYPQKDGDDSPRLAQVDSTSNSEILPPPPIGNLDPGELPLSLGGQSVDKAPPPNFAIEMWSASQRAVVEVPPTH